MRIKRLDLQGFKSFAERTALEFGAGVAGIVGPNGCGKSNVVDAIRWVLGEQQPKTLRGKRMEDMVFNGSDSRRPAGMAEVTMTLSDISDRLPAQWTTGDEVTVTRRLYRSGESEYLINQKPSRLRDIIDLFLDTGLNTHSFSIVEQGRIEALLTAKVEDRREVIEEAAGIMKYKTRRNEALRKLQAAQDNLERINDIVGEVERQTRSLERQAKRASQYREIQDRLREVDGRLLRADYSALQQRIAPKQAAYDDRKRKEAELRAEWSAADGAVEERRQHLAHREEALNRLRGHIHESDAEAQRLEARIELYRGQRESLDAAAETRKEELEALRTESSAAAVAAEHARAEAERHGRVVQEAEEELGGQQARLEEARRTLTEREQAVDADKARVLELADRFTRTRNEIQLIDDQSGSLGRRKEQLAAERERDVGRKITTQENLEAVRRKTNEAAEDLEAARTRELSLQREVQEKTDSLSRREDTIYRLKEELASKASSLAALEDLGRSMEGFGLKALFDGKAEEAGLQGIVSPLADLLEVDPGFETAIESVLGDRLRGAVVEGLPEAKAALEFLRTSGSGRGSLIPRTLRVSSGENNVSSDLQVANGQPYGNPGSGVGGTGQSPGVLGKAMDFVRSPNGFEELIGGLLADVHVVQDLDAALSLWHGSRDFGTLVTRDGEVLYPSGIAIGGMDGEGPLQRRRTIEGLKEETTRLQEEIARSQSSREMERNQRGQIAARLEAEGQSRREAEARVTELRGEMETLSGALARIDETLEVSRFELERVEEEIGALLDRKRVVEETLKQIGTERAAVEARVSDGIRRLAEGRENVESAAEAVSAQRVEMAEVRARAAYLDAETKRMEERRAEIRSRMDRLAADNEADRVRYEELKQADLQARERIQRLHLQKEEWATEARDLEEAIAQDHAFIRETQEYARGFKDRVTALLEELEVISTDLSQLKGERDLLCQRAQITYGIDLAASAAREEETELTEEERETFREESSSLQDRLRRMGDVNMGALSEFEQLNERYQFLKSQQEDLVGSIRSLHETIDRINRTTRRRFKAAFDAINETFGEVFRRLFGGGRASLVLSDENNLLETGVDIVVQPPGKKLGNILLLSAGEKALTAISLLFSIFRYNPSPFCLLDEVDATLDDHNVARFIDILRELSMKTQFIVITHNKRTMSFTDVLYGVTMAEKGASRVVSVELHELSGQSSEEALAHLPRAEETPAEAAVALDPTPSEEDRWAEIEPVDGPPGNGVHHAVEESAKDATADQAGPLADSDADVNGSGESRQGVPTPEVSEEVPAGSVLD